MKKTISRRKPKRILRLPDLDHAKTAVLNTLGSPESRDHTDLPSKTSLHGTALSHDSPSTRPLF